MLKSARVLATALLLVGASGTALLAQTNQQPRPTAPDSQEFRGVSNIAVVTRAATGYRQFEIRQGLTFAPGETLFLYGEPVNFGLNTQPDGRQRLHITVSYEFYNGAGQLVQASQNPTQLINDFQPGTRNIFMRLGTRIPQLADGAYRLQITFRDGFNGAVVNSNRQLSVGAAAPAPQAQAPAPQPPAVPQSPAPPAPQAQPPRPPQTATPAPSPPAAQPAALAADAPQFVQAPATAFRQTAPRRSNVFAPGEQFHVYFEPRNVRTRFDGRTVQGALNVDLLVYTAAGQLLGRQNAHWKLPISVPSTQDAPLTGTYASLAATFNLPAGSYRLVFRVNDELAGTTAEFALDMVIQGAPAPQAPTPQAQAPQAPAPQAQAPQAPAPGTPPRRTGLIP